MGYQVADVAVVGVVHDGDELDSELAQVGAGDGGVFGVSVQPGSGVDDDQVDVAFVFDAGHHLHEHGPMVDVGGAAGWFGVLVDDDGAEFCGFGVAGFALGGDGQPFGVVVGVYLPGAGDAQVDHGPFHVGGALRDAPW